MSKPEYNNYPAVCDTCEKTGKLWHCSSCCGWYHENCFENHDCMTCPFCGKEDCRGWCEEKPGFYDGDKWRRE